MAPRKKAEIIPTATNESRLTSLATAVYQQISVAATAANEAIPGIPSLSEMDAWNQTSDNMTLLFDMLRGINLDRKPKVRATRSQASDMSDVVKSSIGLPLTQLQAVFVKVNIADEGEAPCLERVSMPTLRRWSEDTGHIHHAHALGFLADNGVRFHLRESSGAGKAACILEPLPRPATASSNVVNAAIPQKGRQAQKAA